MSFESPEKNGQGAENLPVETILDLLISNNHESEFKAVRALTHIDPEDQQKAADRFYAQTMAEDPDMLEKVMILTAGTPFRTRLDALKGEIR